MSARSLLRFLAAMILGALLSIAGQYFAGGFRAQQYVAPVIIDNGHCMPASAFSIAELREWNI